LLIKVKGVGTRIIYRGVRVISGLSVGGKDWSVEGVGINRLNEATVDEKSARPPSTSRLHVSLPP
jgi:hypothetical protein